MDRIDALTLFSNVAELGSFTKAAGRLGLTPGAASKQISALEERMQARLLERTTRSVRLTDAGRALLDRIQPWLIEYAAIEDGLAQETAAAAGVLRVSAPVDFGAHCLVEPISEFMNRWPQVEVRLDLADRMVDVVDEGYDLAVRIGHLSDSSLIAKRLSDAPLGLYASPTYLEQSGSPKSAHELSSHACIIDLNAQTPNLWRLTRGDEIEDVRVDGRLSLNGARAALSAASSGVGIAHSPAWAAGDWLDRGDLVKVLPEWQGAHRDLWAVFPSNRFLAHRVRIFVDHLSAWFKNGL